MTALFTVGMMIEKLKEFGPDLPVCVSDWQEHSLWPSNEQASIISQVEGNYNQKTSHGVFVYIGGDE